MQMMTLHGFYHFFRHMDIVPLLLTDELFGYNDNHYQKLVLNGCLLLKAPATTFKMFYVPIKDRGIHSMRQVYSSAMPSIYGHHLYHFRSKCAHKIILPQCFSCIKI